RSSRAALPKPRLRRLPRSRWIGPPRIRRSDPGGIFALHLQHLLENPPRVSEIGFWRKHSRRRAALCGRQHVKPKLFRRSDRGLVKICQRQSRERQNRAARECRLASFHREKRPCRRLKQYLAYSDL